MSTAVAETEIIGSAPADPDAARAAALQELKTLRCRELYACAVLCARDTTTDGHEAAHGAAAIWLCQSVRSLTIEPAQTSDGSAAGECFMAHAMPLTAFLLEASETELWIALAVCLAGPAIDCLVTDQESLRFSDRQALDIAHRLYPHTEPRAMVERWLRRLKQLIAEPAHLHAVVTLADRLRDHGTLPGEDVERLLRAALPDRAGTWLPLLAAFHDELTAT